MKLIDVKKLHDWEIVSISTNYRKKLLSIVIHQPVSNEFKKIEFIDIVKMNISKVKLQNVILDVIVFTEKSDSDDFKYCVNTLNIKDLSMFSEYLLIHFEPSFGAEITCVCREILFSNLKS